MSSHENSKAGQPVTLRCEYMENPLGIDEPRPRLSWIVGETCGQRGVSQTAYQVLVASSLSALEEDRGDVWDSGVVTSDDSTHVEYAGEALKSRKRYYWKVRTWQNGVGPSPWSEPAFWEMGLLDPSEWQADWIAADIEAPTDRSSPCPYLRRDFKIDGPVARARVYVTALGLYELWINGERVGEDYFTPGWTDYNVRVQYQTYDVTSHLQKGENAVGAVLGDGWYCGYLVWQNHRNTYGQYPKLRLQMVVTYEDGREEVICTDGSWKSNTGPILASDIYNGETYDARLEMPGWSAPGFDDQAWSGVKVEDVCSVRLNASSSPRVRKIEELQPVALTEPTPGTYVFDLGQNSVGWARLKVSGPAGTTVTMRFAEVLNPDGTIYTENLRSAKCTDTYTLKGEGLEVYEPRFTFHGFRYVEVTGFPGRPNYENIAGVVVHSDITPTGRFQCSNEMLNQLQHNIIWGQKSNFLEVPTDCPQRDERLGWTGDAQVFVRTACFNHDVAGFFTKWLIDLTDAQSESGAFPKVAPDVLDDKKGDGGAAWADAGIICPWTIYLCYGDKRILQKHYDSMTRYVEYLRTVDPLTRHCFGDWLNVGDPTPNELISVAFAAYSVELMVEIARILGMKADEAYYRALLEQMVDEFRQEFVTPNGRLGSISQTGYVLALHFSLLPDGVWARTARHLVRRIHERKDHLSTGFVGTPYLLFVLERAGYLDLAYKLLLNEDYPSWGYPIKQGATTMWERWDSYRHDKGFQSPKMNSFNHYAYGAVGDWMYRNIAGLEVDPDAPGYKHVIVRPQPGGGLTWAEAALQTLYGELSVRWEISEGVFRLDVSIPANTYGTLHLPASGVAEVRESGRLLKDSPGITDCSVKNRRVVCRVGSGRYQFELPWRE